MNKISGYICSSNAITNDYTLHEAALSLLPVVDELVLSIGPSEDGTRELAERLVKEDTRVRIIDYPHPIPVRQITWWLEWLNWTRERLEHPMQLTLDADEVLCPGSYAGIRKAAKGMECKWFKRINLWRDCHHVAPHGRVCGEQVVRLAPTALWMCSDEPCVPEAEIRLNAGWPPNAAPDMRIFHLGFLRSQEGFYRKVKTVNGGFFGTMDPRVEKAHANGTNWIDECPFDIPLLDYPACDIPEVAHDWLRARGFDPTV